PRARSGRGQLSGRCRGTAGDTRVAAATGPTSRQVARQVVTPGGSTMHGRRSSSATPVTLLASHHIAVPPCSQERSTPDLDADLPVGGLRGVPPGANAPTVNAVEVVPHADGDAVVARVATPAGAKQEMVVVEVAPRRACRHPTAPPVAFEDRVAMTRPGVPFGGNMAEQALEPLPGDVRGFGEGGDGGGQERHPGRRSHAVGRLVLPTSRHR